MLVKLTPTFILLCLLSDHGSLCNSHDMAVLGSRCKPYHRWRNHLFRDGKNWRENVSEESTERYSDESH
jgi:hypothetical protein